MHRSDHTSDRTGPLHHIRQLLTMDEIDLADEQSMRDAYPKKGGQITWTHKRVPLRNTST